MKKSFLKSAALLLSVSLIAGCNISGVEISTVTKETEVSEASAEPPVSDTAKEEETTGEASASSEAGEPKPVEINEITAPFGDTALRVYELPEDKDYYVVDIEGSFAMLSVNDGPVTAVDFSTGETAEKEGRALSEEDWGRYSTAIVNGFPAEVDCFDGKITVFDQSFRVISENTLSLGSETLSFFTDNYYLWCNEENILSYAEIGGDGSVKTGEIRAKLPEDMILSYFPRFVSENELIVSYYSLNDYSSDYGILYMDTGEVVPLSISESSYLTAAGGNIVISEYGSTVVELFDPEKPSVKKVVELPAGATMITPDGNAESIYFYTDLPSEKEGFRSLSIYRYDISDGELTAKLTDEIPGDYAYISNVSECGDYVILSAYINEYARILFWQPENITEPRGYTAISGADLSDDNAKLAGRIKSEYSIDVYYGNDGVRHFDGYAVFAETDEKLINNALVTLDGFLGKFPKGFFEEAMKRSYDCRGISFYLTGKIIPDLNESQSISDAAAFVFSENGCQLMVMDITQSNNLEKNLAHELMHIIEDSMYGMYLDENGDITYREIFSRWDMLNPADFQYYYSYTDENGFTINYSGSEYGGDTYYEGSSADINSIYFVDGYSMTYPHEDRARIFENIATASPDALPTYFKGTAMQLKTAYLCACIRESFDCITDDTVLFWESGINPAYNLEYFWSNYDLDAYLSENAVG
ncbi:MAG: hypothetical protein ACI4J4_04065 [Ruminiclostridium sp.]